MSSEEELMLTTLLYQAALKLQLGGWGAADRDRTFEQLMVDAGGSFVLGRTHPAAALVS
jgi:hypothetical protein